jgi:hypothetical protein
MTVGSWAEEGALGLFLVFRCSAHAAIESEEAKGFSEFSMRVERRLVPVGFVRRTGRGQSIFFHSFFDSEQTAMINRSEVEMNVLIVQ